MSAVATRLSVSALAVVLASFALDSHAQVTIHMTTAQQAACDATTDASGVSLVPGSTDLQANGVTLSGGGCGGSGSTDFQASVTAQATATVGIPFTVTWSASPAASTCVYGAPTSGVTGWPAGTVACQDSASCGTSHQVPVTISTAGSYNFSVTCTNSTGFAQSASVSAGGTTNPPTPDNFPLTVPATGTTGIPFSVSWSVSYATTCTGSASLNGSSASLPGWTDVTTPTSPRTVTPSVAGTYDLQLVCSNSLGSVTSQQASIAVAQGSTSCQAPAGLTRITTGNLFYPPSTTLRNNVDLTVWDNIWGHNTASDTLVPWPGFPGSNPVIKNFGKTQFLAAKLHTTSSTTLSGFYKNISYNGGPNLTMAISTTCGSFSPTQSACLKENVPASDQGMVYWRMSAGTSFYCHLDGNTDYYVNIKLADPAATGPNCSGSTCYVHVQNNYGG